MPTPKNINIKFTASGNLLEEIKKIAVHMADAWLPAAAADKVRLLEASGIPQDQIETADKITHTVNSN